MVGKYVSAQYRLAGLLYSACVYVLPEHDGLVAFHTPLLWHSMVTVVTVGPLVEIWNPVLQVYVTACE